MHSDLPQTFQVLKEKAATAELEVGFQIKKIIFDI